MREKTRQALIKARRDNNRLAVAEILCRFVGADLEAACQAITPFPVFITGVQDNYASRVAVRFTRERPEMPPIGAAWQAVYGRQRIIKGNVFSEIAARQAANDAVEPINQVLPCKYVVNGIK